MTPYALLTIVSCLLAPLGCKSACKPDPTPSPSPSPSPKPAPKPGPGTVSLVNGSSGAATVYLAFGSDSVVTPAALGALCGDAGAGVLTCQFSLAKGAAQVLETAGLYLNATVAFGAPVGCGVTKAELNVNNPKWYDTVDISLVDGFSNKVSIAIDGVVLGPPAGAAGNEDVLGVFPVGCDLCVSRSSNAPCGFEAGTTGCKAGTQYDPKPPCQYQGAKMGGGSAVVVTLL